MASRPAKLSRRQLWAVLPALLVLAGCAAERSPGELFGPTESGILVVDAQLIVDEPMPDIYLRRTADPAQSYDANAQGVLQADVTVSFDGGQVTFAADADVPGRFAPVGDAPVVQPLSVYDLSVRVGDENLTGRTRTPGRLRLREAVVLDETSLDIRRQLVLFSEADDIWAEAANQVEYLDGLLEVRAAPVTGAAAFQLSLFSLDLDSDFVVDADFLEADDYEEFEREGASPPLDGVDGRVRMPWFAIAFAGRHVWRTYALDENWYDFVRTDPRGGGFGQLAGDSFQRPRFHIKGGIGLFGSAAVDSVGFVVLPRRSN